MMVFNCGDAPKLPDEWKSDVLRALDDDTDCLICRFIRGDRTKAAMMAVIRQLDNDLADEREHTQKLLSAVLEELNRQSFSAASLARKLKGSN